MSPLPAATRSCSAATDWSWPQPSSGRIRYRSASAPADPFARSFGPVSGISPRPAMISTSRRSGIIFLFVLPAPLASRVQTHRCKSARTMKIHVRVQVRGVELVNGFGVLAADVAVANVLADDRSVLAFYQRVVLGPIGAAFGEFDQQTFEQLRQFVIDVLRAVVGVKAENTEGKLMQDRPQHGPQILLADLADATYCFPLRHRIHSVDVIHTLGPVPIALMHRVDAQEPRPPLRIWFSPFPDGDCARMRQLPSCRQLPVARAPAQIVQMRHRDSRQAHIPGVAELLALPLQNMRRRRSAQPVVGAIHSGQQRHVLTGVFHRKPATPVCGRFHHAFLPVLADQTCHLRQAQAGYFPQVRSYRSPLLPALERVFLCHQHSLHPAIQLGPILAAEFDRPAALQKFLNLCLRQILCVLHAYSHPAAERLTTSHFHDHLVLESMSVSGSSCIGQFFTTPRVADRDILGGQSAVSYTHLTLPTIYSV